MPLMVFNLILTLLFAQESPQQKKAEGLLGFVRSVRTEITRVSKEGIEGQRFSFSVMTFDSQGRIKEEASYLNEKELLSKTIYSYEADGNRIEKTILNKFDGTQDTRVFKYTYKYDSQGNKLEERKFAADDRLLSTIFSRHDEKNNLLETYELSPNPSHSKCTEIFTDRRLMKERTCFDLKGSLATNESYSYEFDSTGNWVKRVGTYMQMKDEKQQYGGKTIVYRTIKYFSSHAEAEASNQDPSSEIPSNIKPLSPRPLVVRKSGGVLAGSATKRVEPIYPISAIVAKIKGSVVVEVTVNEVGKVEKAVALSGPQELHQTTLEAAKQWEFKPTLLSGVPAKVIGTITFNFNL